MLSKANDCQGIYLTQRSSKEKTVIPALFILMNL